MVTSYVIGLREGLEAALIVGVLIAYLVRSQKGALLPAVWAGLGIAAGISLGVGATLTFGPRQFPPEVADTLAGTLGLAAVVLMTWMVFWMARASRSLRGLLEDSLGRAAGLGWGAVFTVALLAVGREGLEMALFLWTQVSAAGSAPAPLIGALLGILTAIALGWTVYRGAVRINLARFFTWTGFFLILLAAGVLAHALHELQEAGVIRVFDSVAFDVSAQVPESSWHGAVLKGVFGFSPTPSILEATAWLVYLTITPFLFAHVLRRGTDQRSGRSLGTAELEHAKETPTGRTARVPAA